MESDKLTIVILAAAWSSIAALILVLSVIRAFGDFERSVTGLVVGAIVAWRAYSLIRRWWVYRKLEERISCEAGAQETAEICGHALDIISRNLLEDKKSDFLS